MIVWLAALGVALLLWQRSKRLPEKFPPGPRFPLPFIGDLLSLGSNTVKGLNSLKEKYPGGAIGLYLGTRRNVFLTDPNLFREAFSMEEFSSSNPVAAEIREKTRNGDSTGIFATTDGSVWAEQRRFTLKTLRNMGFGKEGMEGIIEEEVEQVCMDIDKDQDSKGYCNMADRFNIPALAALWNFLTNEKLPHDHPKLKEIQRQITAAFNFPGPLFVVSQAVPPLRILFEKLNLLNFNQAFEGLLNFAKKATKDHEKTYQEDNQRDFLDRYIKKRYDEGANPSSSFHGQDGRFQMESFIMDMMFAGSQTTSITLNWMFIYMALYPEVQRRVQEEIETVTGGSRKLSWADKESTPYTEAVLWEAQRHGDILPFGVPHETNADVNLGDYFIPKGTVVQPLLTAMLQDPKAFPDPEAFKPERFFRDGKFYQDPRVTPFSVGKRRCLGESLARLELYLFFTHMMQRYTVSPRPNHTLNLERNRAMMEPKPHDLVFTVRG